MTTGLRSQFPRRQSAVTIRIGCLEPVFDDGEVFTFRSHVNVRPRFAYYRFPQGTVAYGPAIRDLPDAERDAVFNSAALTPTEQRVARAVSKAPLPFETSDAWSDPLNVI